MIRYPATLTRHDNGAVLVAFPDFPEARTFGNDKAEALSRGVSALESIIDAYIRDRRDIPTPSRVTTDGITLRSLVAVKVQLYRRMRQERVSKSELARRLNVHLPQIDRLLNIRHGSRLEQLDAAAHALGGVLDVLLVLPENVAPASAAQKRRLAGSARKNKGRKTR